MSRRKSSLLSRGALLLSLFLAQSAQAEVSDIHAAAAAGDLAGLQAKAGRLSHLEAKDPRGRTPLHLAVLENEAEVVAWLAERGVALDAQDQFELAPLHYAAKAGRMALAEILLEAGADPNARSRRGQAPLHFACGRGQLPLVERLLAAGAKADPTDEDGTSPLHWAAAAGQGAVIRALTEAGADPDLRSRAGTTPPHLAAAGKHADALVALAEADAQLDLRFEGDLSLLVFAAKAGALPLVELALGHEPAQTQLDEALQAAAAEAQVPVMARLLAAGADPGLRLPPYMPPYSRYRAPDPPPEEMELLEYGLKAGSPELVAAAADHGAALDGRLRDGETPVAWAVRDGPPEVLAILLQRGAEPDALLADGQSPLQLALRQRNLAMVRALLEAGADIHRPTPTGLDLLSLLLVPTDQPSRRSRSTASVFQDDQENPSASPAALAAILLEHGIPVESQLSNGWPPLAWATSRRDPALARQLVLRGADVNRAHEGRTPLSLALHRELGALAELLAASGAHLGPSPSEAELNQALLSAVELRVSTSVRLLLDLGADANAKGREHHALHLAAKLGDAALCRILLDAGAEAGLGGRYGKTPLRLAVDGNHAQVVFLLLEAGADPRAADNSALDQAAGAGNLALLEPMLAQVPSGKPMQEALNRALHRAMGGEAEHLATARFLLDQGAEVDTRHAEDTPLMAAARAGNLPLVQLLIERGAELDATGRLGWTALARAVKHVDVVRCLLEAGARVDGAIRTMGELEEMKEDGPAEERGPSQEERIKAAGLPFVDPLARQPREAQLVSIEFAEGPDPGDRVNSPLLYAADEGHEVIPVLLAAGADPNWIGRRESSALLVLAANYAPRGEDPQLAAARALLDAGAEIDHADQFGATALIVATERKRPLFVRLLLDAGAAIDHAAANGRTALIVATQQEQLELVQLLLEAGAHADARDELGNSALVYARLEEDEDLAQMLLDHGADPTAQANLSEAMIEALRRVKELEKLLAAGADPNDRTAKGMTVLQKAVEKYERQALPLLLEHGADPNQDTDKGVPLLVHTARRGTPNDIVAMLLDHGADLERADEEGMTPLMAAARATEPDLIAFLAERGADLGARDNEGRTALHRASSWPFESKLPAVQALIEAGADPNARDPEGLTPLMVVETMPAFEALLEAGATLDARAEDGRNPLWCAIDNYQYEIAKALLERGASLGATDAEGRGVLHGAVRRLYKTPLLEELLAAGADPALRGSFGFTPLALAVYYGRTNAVRSLLAHGADPNTRDAQGMTALMWAAARDKPITAGVLLENGADPNLEVGDGHSALDYARAAGHEKLVSLLSGL